MGDGSNFANLNYIGLIPYLISSIQELNERVVYLETTEKEKTATLETEVSTLKNQVSTFETQMSELLARIASLENNNSTTTTDARIMQQLPMVHKML